MSTERSPRSSRDRRVGFAARVVCASVTVVIGVVAGAGTAAASIGIYTHPGLEQARTYITNPFPGTTVKPSDAEGLAYVPTPDNSIWLADDNGHRLFEINATTGALKRTITQSMLAAAVQLGGTATAGTNTASDMEAMAYDPVHDILYAFAGKCCSSGIRAAAFRLMRDGNGVFQVESFQPFTAPLNDFSGVGEIDGELWGALGKVLYKYNYVTNTFSNNFTVSGVSGSIYGISDSPSGQPDVWFTGSSSTLYRFNWATRTLYPNHTFSMTSRGVRDARAVDVVNDELIICDGYDSYSSSSPDRYAIKVFDVINLDAAQPPAASFTVTPATGPAPLAVQLTDTSTNGPTSWQWVFGDGGTATAQSPTHTFAAGTYTVTLTATNANGSSTTTRSVTATAPQPPVASFTANPTTGAAPLAVQLTDTSTNGPTSWLWDFGDGGTSTAQSPTHTFAEGTRTVTLTATNANGSTSATKTITATGPLNSFPPTKDSFANSASPTKNYGTYDYLRALAGSSEYRPYLSFNVSGLGGPVARAVLRLFVTDASTKGGDWYAVDPSWNESGLNWNNAPPIGGALLSSVGAVSANTWVEVDVTPAIAGNGSYSFAALTTSTNTLKYSSKEGLNPPQLVITPGNSSAPPVAAFTASTTSGAAPLDVSFTDASTANATSWAWDFGDGGTANGQNPSHTFNQVGSFVVTLTAGNANGSTSATKTITTTAPTSNGTFPAAMDSIVSAGSPTKNYGSYDYIRGLLSPPDEYRPYVSFNVSGLSGTVTRAVIRLYVTDGSDKGGAWYPVDASAWTESGLIWNNAPPLTGTPVANIGAVAAGTWIEIDVTAIVTGNGSYSFGATTTSANSVRYSSKEGANPPQLVVTTA